MNDQPRMVKLADLWQRKSAKGTVYFSGFMGDCQVLLFKEGRKSHPTRPDEEVIVWKLLMQEKDPNRRPQGRQNDRTRAAPAKTAGGALIDAAPRNDGTWSADRERDPGQHDTPSGPNDDLPF